MYVTHIRNIHYTVHYELCVYYMRLLVKNHRTKIHFRQRSWSLGELLSRHLKNNTFILRTLQVEFIYNYNLIY